MIHRRIFVAGLVTSLLATGCQGSEPKDRPSADPAMSPSEQASSLPSPRDVSGEDISVGEYQLPGTLVIPKSGQRIAAVFLWGSGPHDRDGTVGAANNKIFRDLAVALADQGIASLRFDKRTKAAAEKTDITTLTLADEYFEDTAAALKLLQERLPDNRIFVIGHSQGGMVLPEVLNQNPTVAGGISLAGTPRSLFDVIYSQNEVLINADKTTSPEQKKKALKNQRIVMDALKQIDSPDDEVPFPYNSSMGANYIASLNKLNPAATARRLTVPLLFLQGEADQQVFVDPDFNAWKNALEGRPNTEFRLFPTLNHFFWPTQGKSAQDDLNAPATVDPQVSETIVSWLLKHGQG